MVLEKIISLANKTTQLRFTAMERSLRATGCTLPLWVIPYDNQLFDLPDNAYWVEKNAVIEWVDGYGCRGVYRKYWCLLQQNYLFVDADIIFLRNPATVLQPMEGFITSCGHWHNPGQTYTDQSLRIFTSVSTTWQKNVFNSGQFACDRILFSFEELQQLATAPAYMDTLLRFQFHEQPGLNLLVHLSNVPVHNLTLPPYHMQSTWAGDYLQPHFAAQWNDYNKPLLIHWAGCNPLVARPIDRLFLSCLSLPEQQQWALELQAYKATKSTLYKKCRIYLSQLKQAVQKVQWPD